MTNWRKLLPRRYGLLLVLICILGIPHLAGAGPARPIPVGPLDEFGNPAVPDYYTTANWANSPPLAKFVDSLPTIGKPNNLGQVLTVGKPDVTSYPGSDYYEIELVEFKEQMHSDLPNKTLLRGYRQVNLGTNLSPGTLPSQNLCGADRHPCTPADTAAGVGLAPDPVRYLGPSLVTERDRPVRIKFTNRLPTGPSGDLFIPVDATVMGAGSGPAAATGTRGVGVPCDNTIEPNACASYTHNRADIHLHGGRTPWISDGTPHQWITPALENTPFAKGPSFYNVPDMPDPGDGSMTYYWTNQQSARLMFYHDHAFGITRLNVYAGEAAGYLITDQWEQDLIARGLVPPDQIPLIIQDKTFVDATPTTKYLYNAVTKLFDIPITVPAVRVTDPLWNWGSGPVTGGVREPVTGDLWLPHVYMPAQTLAAGYGGVNPFGRWMYGPWFYPATAVPKGPVPNPYYDQDCSSPFQAVYLNCSTPGQPTMIPGTPHPSMGMEAFQDSVVVNGTVFPTLTVDPRAYRFRILNAASDRFWNLSFYEADPVNVSPDPRLNDPAVTDRSNRTEVKMLPASLSLAQAQNWPADWPVDARDGGVPDPATRGPAFLQIGTEGGFLPAPDLRVPQPVTYMTDPTAFWVGVVDKTGLALGPAERADVVVDFSAYAGKTLILYNDAPAAWPARVAGYDYYTGAPDLRDSGGYGTGGIFDPATGTWIGGTGPLPGYAPNTRTVMQVIVRPAGSTVDGTYTFDQARLEAEFTTAAEPTAINPVIPGSNPPRAMTLFERSQDPILVGQLAYSSAYPDSYFPPNYPWQGINQINDHFLKFVTLAGEPVTAPTEPKGIHDEMGASFDPVYGRMSGNLGMQLPNPTTLNANLVLYGFTDLPTETIDNSPQFNIQVVPDLVNGFFKPGDGTQIWKISHNGVDTHPIHFHVFDVQLVNRVGWDGQTLLPEPNEMGWKDTVKISPLMDTIVAVRMRAPALPFGVPDSLRPLNPAIPLDSPMGFNSVDWQTGQARVPAVTNQLFDFKWEYVWHCHILSHEEMDMMRPVVLTVPSTAPGAPVLADPVSGPSIALAWSDPTPVDYVTRAGFGDPTGEVGFNVLRAPEGGGFVQIASLPANSTSFTDATFPGGTVQYQVVAYNTSGSTASNTVVLSSAPPPAVATTSLPAGRVGLPYSQTLAATGGATPLTWSVSAGALPAGLTLDPATGAIAGTPTAFGTFGFTVQVTDTRQLSGTQALSITVNPAPVAIATTTLPTAWIGLAYSQALAATGGIPPYTWTITAGALPAGFTLNAATGVISGTATVANVSTFTVRATASNGSFASRQLTLRTAQQLAITTTALSDGTIGVPYAQTVFATGGTGGYTWSVISGALPTGLQLAANSGLINRTPTVPGTYSFTVQVTDAAGATASQALSINILGVVPAAPTNLTAAIATASRITLTWRDNSNTESSFAVWRSVNGQPATSVTVTRTAAQTTATGGTVTYNDTTVTAGNSYAYFVTAVNSTGASAPTATQTVAFLVPAVPVLTNLSAVNAGTTDTVTVTWTDVATETSYTVQRATNATFTTGVGNINGIAANATTTQDTGRPLNRTLYYRVRANNTVGSSAWSNQMSILTP